MSKSGIHQITVRLDAEIKQKLDAFAAAHGQAVDSLASDAIVHFLEQVETLTPAEKAAVQSWEHYKATGLHLTMAEADAWLAELEGGHDVEPPPCHR